MRGALLFAVGVIVGTLVIKPTAAQEKKGLGLRLMVVGFNVKDYPAEQNFFTKVMGFKTGFEFSPNGTRMNTYYQLSRDTFLEMAQTGPNAPAAWSHIHMQTDNIAAVIAQIRQNGGTITDMRIAEPTHERSATIKDPDGIIIEPTELIPGSMTLKAVDSWQ